MASPSLISSGKGGASGSTSPTLSAGTITAGNTVLAFASDTDGNTLSVTGSSGGAYTLVGQIGSLNPRLWCFKKENHPGGAETLTFSFGSAADPALSFAQYSASTVDASSLNSGNTSSNPLALSSNTLASVNSTVVLLTGSDEGGTVNYTESTGFTEDQEQSDGNLYWSHAIFHKAVSATTAVSSSTSTNGSFGSLKGIIFALTATGGGSGSTITPAAGATTTSTLTGRATSTSTPTAAAGVATTSNVAGRANAASAVTAAAGVATTSSLTGRAGVAAAITPAAGQATSSTITAASSAAANATPAAGQATTSSLQGSSTAQASMSPAVGQATAGTLVGSGQQPGSASILPAAGTSTAGTLQGSALVASTIVPAAGVATTSTLASNGAPARGMEVDYEAAPGQRPRRAKFVSIKPPLQAALESRLPEPEIEELNEPQAANAVSAGIQALQNEQLTPELVARLAQQWRPAAAIAQNASPQDAQSQYLRAVMAEKQVREAQAAQLDDQRRRAKARADDEEAIARAVALLF